MKNLFLLFTAFFFNNILIIAQPDTVWSRFYGVGRENWGHSMVETEDNGFIIVGATLPKEGGNEDLWIFKTDNYGSLLWSKTYGTDGTPDVGRQIKKTNDGNYIVVGTKSLGVATNIWLLKINPQGDTIWTRTYSGVLNVVGYSVDLTIDGGYILLGWEGLSFIQSVDLLLIKTDSLGNMLWSKSYGTPQDDVAWLVKTTSDSGYIIIGTKDFLQNGDIWLLKTDSIGDTLWTKTYYGLGHDEGKYVLETSDGSFIITGSIIPPISPNNSNLFLLKTDPNGNTVWLKTYGDQNISQGSYIIETTNSEYITIGYKQNSTGSSNIWILKTDTLGDTIWTKTIGETGTSIAEAIIKTINDEFVVLGWTDLFFPISVWLIKLENDPLHIGENIINNSFYLSQNFPNPFNPTTKINYSIAKLSLVTLEVFDLLGKKVSVLVDEYKNIGNYEVIFNASYLPSGIYFYQLQSDNFIETKKLMLIK